LLEPGRYMRCSGCGMTRGFGARRSRGRNASLGQSAPSESTAPGRQFTAPLLSTRRLRLPARVVGPASSGLNRPTTFKLSANVFPGHPCANEPVEPPAVMLPCGLAIARLERREVSARFDGGVLSIAVVGSDSWGAGAAPRFASLRPKITLSLLHLQDRDFFASPCLSGVLLACCRLEVPVSQWLSVSSGVGWGCSLCETRRTKFLGPVDDERC
jgi:hypothetical protein